jgi:hypothetical protein
MMMMMMMMCVLLIASDDLRERSLFSFLVMSPHPVDPRHVISGLTNREESVAYMSYIK